MAFARTSDRIDLIPWGPYTMAWGNWFTPITYLTGGIDLSGTFKNNYGFSWVHYVMATPMVVDTDGAGDDQVCIPRWDQANQKLQIFRCINGNPELANGTSVNGSAGTGALSTLTIIGKLGT